MQRLVQYVILLPLSFMREFKELLKRRFEQIDVWITAQRIEVL